jgi:hypothetical protein
MLPTETKTSDSQSNDGVNLQQFPNASSESYVISDEEFARKFDLYYEKMVGDTPFKNIKLGFYPYIISLLLTYSVSVTIALFTLYYQLKSENNTYVTSSSLESTLNGYVTRDFLTNCDDITGLTSIISCVNENLNSVTTYTYVTTTYLSDYNYVQQDTTKLQHYNTTSQLDVLIDQEVNSYLDSNIFKYQPILVHYNSAPFTDVTAQGISENNFVSFDKFSFQKAGYYETDVCVTVGGENIYEVDFTQTVCSNANICSSETDAYALGYAESSNSDMSDGIEVCFKAVVFALNVGDAVTFYYKWLSYSPYPDSYDISYQVSISYLPNSIVALTNSGGVASDYSSVLTYNGFCPTTGC